MMFNSPSLSLRKCLVAQLRSWNGESCFIHCESLFLSQTSSINGIGNGEWISCAPTTLMCHNNFERIRSVQKLFYSSSEDSRKVGSAKDFEESPRNELDKLVPLLRTQRQVFWCCVANVFCGGIGTIIASLIEDKEAPEDDASKVTKLTMGVLQFVLSLGGIGWIWSIMWCFKMSRKRRDHFKLHGYTYLDDFRKEPEDPEDDLDNS